MQWLPARGAVDGLDVRRPSARPPARGGTARRDDGVHRRLLPPGHDGVASDEPPRRGRDGDSVDHPWTTDGGRTGPAVAGRGLGPAGRGADPARAVSDGAERRPRRPSRWISRRADAVGALHLRRPPVLHRLPGAVRRLPAGLRSYASHFLTVFRSREYCSSPSSPKRDPPLIASPPRQITRTRDFPRR